MGKHRVNKKILDKRLMVLFRYDVPVSGVDDFTDFVCFACLEN